MLGFFFIRFVLLPVTPLNTAINKKKFRDQGNVNDEQKNFAQVYLEFHVGSSLILESFLVCGCVGGLTGAGKVE